MVLKQDLSNERLVIAASDAEALALMLGDRNRRERAVPESTDALTDVLQTADIVPDAELPDDRVRMGTTVTYADPATGKEDRLTLTYPDEAVPGDGRVSVLSPVGAALIGRRAGESVHIELPNGRSRTISILAVEHTARPREASPRAGTALA